MVTVGNWKLPALSMLLCVPLNLGPLSLFRQEFVLNIELLFFYSFKFSCIFCLFLFF